MRGGGGGGVLGHLGSCIANTVKGMGSMSTAQTKKTTLIYTKPQTPNPKSQTPNPKP